MEFKPDEKFDLSNKEDLKLLKQRLMNFNFDEEQPKTEIEEEKKEIPIMKIPVIDGKKYKLVKEVPRDLTMTPRAKSITVKCECGGRFTQTNKTGHLRTNLHKRYIAMVKSLNQTSFETIDKTREKDKKREKI